MRSADRSPSNEKLSDADLDRLLEFERLIRADLFAGRRCPADEWLRIRRWLPVPQYYACHHFDFTP